jgi:hypothetical protein
MIKSLKTNYYHERKYNWNRGKNLEPVTKSFPEFGSGGATQVITNKLINNYKIKELPKQ